MRKDPPPILLCFSVSGCSDLPCRYVYASRAGILPAAAYLGAKLGGTKAAYFERAARTVLKRRNIDFDRFDWERDPSGAATLARVFTLAANYFAYCPDVVFLPSAADRRRFVRKGLESFDYARMRGGGDCEDDALEIVLEAAELAALDPDSLSPAMRAMQALRRRYVFSMALGGVTAAEINDERIQDRISAAMRRAGPGADYYSVWKQLGLEIGAHM